MIHAEFIDRLGGAPELARLLDLPSNVPGNWRTRPTGIAWPWRPQVAEIAREKNVPLPIGFLDPKHRGVMQAAGAHAGNKPARKPRVAV